MAFQVSRHRVKSFGHRTRTGCSVCRQRKIKCDEGRPSCRRCVLARRQCPGYVDNRPLIGPVGRTTLPLSLPQIGGSQDSLDLLHLVPALIDRQGGKANYLNQLIPSIVSVSSLHLPSRAGHNYALDCAMSCAATGIRELFTDGYSKQSRSFYYLANPSLELTRLYTNAVNALRCALDDRRQSSMPEILLAALVICCFETMREHSDETVQLHLYGLSKIYEHRGPPYIDDKLEKRLLLGCVPLAITSCFVRNSPCFLAQKQWVNIIQHYRSSLGNSELGFRQKWFLDNQRLCARRTTLLADCSDFIFDMSYNSTAYSDARRELISRIKRTNKTCERLRDAKVREISKDSSDATLLSLCEELGSTKEGRTDYYIYYLGVYAETTIICSILQVALGGHGVKVVLDDVVALVEWMEKFAQRLPPDDFQWDCILEDLMKSTLATSNQWRRFAATAEARKRQERPVAVEPQLFRQWLILAGVVPRERK